MRDKKRAYINISIFSIGGIGITIVIWGSLFSRDKDSPPLQPVSQHQIEAAIEAAQAAERDRQHQEQEQRKQYAHKLFSQVSREFNNFNGSSLVSGEDFGDRNIKIKNYCISDSLQYYNSISSRGLALELRGVGVEELAEASRKWNWLKMISLLEGLPYTQFPETEVIDTAFKELQRGDKVQMYLKGNFEDLPPEYIHIVSIKSFEARMFVDLSRDVDVQNIRNKLTQSLQNPNLSYDQRMMIIDNYQREKMVTSLKESQERANEFLREEMVKRLNKYWDDDIVEYTGNLKDGSGYSYSLWKQHPDGNGYYRGLWPWQVYDGESGPIEEQRYFVFGLQDNLIREMCDFLNNYMRKVVNECREEVKRGEINGKQAASIMNREHSQILVSLLADPQKAESRMWKWQRLYPQQ